MMRDPSGDHEGDQSMRRDLVTWKYPGLFIETVQMSMCTNRPHWKTISDTCSGFHPRTVAAVRIHQHEDA
jgi:hypothetical protein